MRPSVPDRLETKSFILFKRCTKASGLETMGTGGVGLGSLIQVSVTAWFGSHMRFRRTRYEQYPHSHQAEHFIRPLALQVIQ